MKLDPQSNINNRRSNRRGERGAALVTMLLVTILLLGAGGALIMTTMMSANNSVGSTAEMQAFYIAESGMQSALNVLRGNAQPLVTAAHRLRLRTAITRSSCKGAGPTAALRLAGWLPYSARCDEGRLLPMTVGTSTRGYRLTVENMDAGSDIGDFETSGIID